MRKTAPLGRVTDVIPSDLPNGGRSSDELGAPSLSPSRVLRSDQAAGPELMEEREVPAEMST